MELIRPVRVWFSLLHIFTCLHFHFHFFPFLLPFFFPPVSRFIVRKRCMLPLDDQLNGDQVRLPDSGLLLLAYRAKDSLSLSHPVTTWGTLWRRIRVVN